MNQQLKTVLLTVATLSLFVIALVELSGVSSHALFNKYGIGDGGSHVHEDESKIVEREQRAKNLPKTQIRFDNTRHDFGTITEGEKVSHTYHFTNTGEHPLLISNVEVTCGCTVPSYPKEPIPPGGEGDIVLEFNSYRRAGHQQKNALVHSNAVEEAMSIGFVVEVEEK